MYEQQQAGGFRPSVFDAAGVPAPHRFECLNDFFSKEGMKVGPKAALGADIGTSRKLWHTDDGCFFTESYSEGHLGFRPAAQRENYLSVRKYTGGTGKIWSEHGNVTVQSGTILISATPGDIVFDTDHLEASAVLISFDLLDIDPARFHHMQKLQEGSATYRLVSAAMHLWRQEVDAIHPTETTQLVNTFSGLLNGILQPGSSDFGEAPEEEALRGHAIRQYVDGFAVSTPPTVAQICAHFGVSRATVYRVFQPDGGLATYMKTRQLEHALRALSRSTGHKGVVSKVAEEVGFTDSFHFSRAFKAQYGFSPSEIAGVPVVQKTA